MADKKVLSEFARRAAQRLKDRKKSTKYKVFVPSIDEEIELRTLLDDELMDIFDSESDSGGRKRDQMCIYEAAVNPNLREIASELMEAGEITEYRQVVGMFSLAEQKKLTEIIMEKSGILMDENEAPRVVDKVVDNIKN